MYGVKSHVCSAFATSVRQTFFPHWTWDSHFTLAINLVAKQPQFLDNCMGTLWLREGSKESLVSILNYFVCPVPSLLLVDLFKFSRGTKWSTLWKQSCIPSCPLARTWWAKPGTLLPRFSLLLGFVAEMSFISSQNLVQGQCQPWAFSLLLAPLGVWQEVGQWVPWQQWNVKVTSGKDFVILKAMELFQMELTPT